ncbi:hypothetical protein CARUB_v10020762mg [Capsella rubella]|uniref:RRM domain-containing protein n=1 Tax=Capsella rubella TaxID=81985 RepID=R0GIM2_9BRAS|nr:nucleolin 1 [Capsella rubella]EOA35556.1 hypothetical protein CARUB_v10020762mg [Capsella rubella]
MAGSSKKSATKGESTPALIKATKSVKKSKRKQEDDSKRPKKDVTIAPLKKKKSGRKKIMKEIVDRLQRLEAKMDLLATKADLEAILISAKGEKVPAIKPPAKAASDSEDSSYMDTSSDEQVTVSKNPHAAAKKVSVKAKTENSSSQDDSSSDEEPVNNPAAFTKPAAKHSPSSIGDNPQTISVTGFDPSIHVDDVNIILSRYFSSFGEITRVFVPADGDTDASLGYAYIDLKQGADKALKIARHDVGGWNLVVGTAEPIQSGSWLFNGRCGSRGFCGYC